MPPPSQHEYHPNELVIIKRHRKETLEPSWKGPYIVILTTPTVVMGNGVPVWIYHLHANSEDYALETTWDLWKAVAHPQNPLRLRIQKVTNPAKLRIGHVPVLLWPVPTGV